MSAPRAAAQLLRIASAPRSFVPPATTRAGTAQRAVPTIALNTYFAVGKPPLIRLRSWSRWFPIQVPVTVPNTLELHRLRMAIGHSDIDRARQLLALVRLRLLHFSSVIAIM